MLSFESERGAYDDVGEENNPASLHFVGEKDVGIVFNGIYRFEN